jgi:predicted kinase
MIVWINGPFGVGKSTVAALVCELVPGARPFDPERIGHLLGEVVEVPTGDFQDLRLWRALTVATLAGLCREHGGIWVVPMTVIDDGYRAEIMSGLRGHGVQVRQFLLTAPEPVVRARIDADHSLPAAGREWRHRHLTRALTAFNGPAGRDPEVAEVDACGPPGRLARVIASRALGTIPAAAYPEL